MHKDHTPETFECDIDIEDEVHEIPFADLYITDNYYGCLKHLGPFESAEHAAEGGVLSASSYTDICWSGVCH